MIPEHESPPGPGVRALRVVAALPTYLLLAAALTIAVALLTGLSWMAVDAWVHASIGVALFHLNASPALPRPRRWALSVVLFAGGIAFVSTGPRSDESGWLLAACGAAFLASAASRFRRSVLGEGAHIPTVELLGWMVVFFTVAWFVNGIALVVVFFLFLVRQVPLFAELGRARPRIGALGGSLAIVALALLPFRTSFEAEPVACRVIGEAGHFMDPDARWIVTLGDSTTEGVFVPERISYAGMLQEFLRSEAGARYRVANCGFSGARSDQLLEQLERGLAFEPEVVTILIGNNDTLLDPSRTKRAVIETWKDRIREAVQRVREAGARPILVTALNGLAIQGDFVRWLHEATHEVGRELDVQVVDPQTAAARRSGVVLHVIPDFVHPNEMGHSLIAELIADAVRRPPATPAR